MTGQNDWQDRSLTGQVRDQAGHCPLTGRYFQPCMAPIVQKMDYPAIHLVNPYPVDNAINNWFP